MRGRPAAALPAALALAALAAARTPSPSQPGKPSVVTSLTLFAGTERGLMRSRNWGSDWERVQGRALDALGAARCIIALGPQVYVGGDGGLFLSEDFGEAWMRLYSATPALSLITSRYPLADPTLFLGTPTGLLRSEDGGRAFRETGLRGAPVHRIEWPGPALVAGTGRGVQVSPDGGDHFEAAGTGLPEGEVRALALSSYYIVDPVLFAGVGSAGVFRSGDGARTWAPAGLPGRSVEDLVWLGPFLYAATDAGLYRSEDLGLSWTPLGEAGRAARRLLFPLAPASGAEAFLGTDRGVHWTGDGGAYWRASGLAGERVLCLGTFPPPDPQRRKK